MKKYVVQMLLTADDGRHRTRDKEQWTRLQGRGGQGTSGTRDSRRAAQLAKLVILANHGWSGGRRRMREKNSQDEGPNWPN